MVQYQFQIIGHDFLQSHFQAGWFLEASNSPYGTTSTYILSVLFIRGARVAQWVRSVDPTTHTSLSPIRRGFAPSFVNNKKWIRHLVCMCCNRNKMIVSLHGAFRLWYNIQTCFNWTKSPWIRYCFVYIDVVP
jgi:hypothetical protein